MELPLHRQNAPDGLSPSLPVATFVARQPATARVFERLGIDYCCQGRRSVTQACEARGLSVDEVLTELRSAGDVSPGEPEVSGMSMTQLADHIEATHHAMLKAELPRLAEMAAKVERAHSDRHPELHELRRVFDMMAGEMAEHMTKEERILFPALRKIDRLGSGPGWIVQGAIRCMEHEHEDAGRALSQMRSITGGFIPPADACPTYRALLHGFQELEADMHRHVHKENYVLFPKVEAAMSAGPSEAAFGDTAGGH